ncbi:hypothetical protein LTR17_020951 [Elasticomyces elasticus]|nr:hypothetical protein LTR17_020951 [Elasticomyces elasticus]
MAPKDPYSARLNKAGRDFIDGGGAHDPYSPTQHNYWLNRNVTDEKKTALYYGSRSPQCTNETTWLREVRRRELAYDTQARADHAPSDSVEALRIELEEFDHIRTNNEYNVIDGSEVDSMWEHFALTADTKAEVYRGNTIIQAEHTLPHTTSVRQPTPILIESDTDHHTSSEAEDDDELDIPQAINFKFIEAIPTPALQSCVRTYKRNAWLPHIDWLGDSDWQDEFRDVEAFTELLYMVRQNTEVVFTEYAAHGMKVVYDEDRESLRKAIGARGRYDIAQKICGAITPLQYAQSASVLSDILSQPCMADVDTLLDSQPSDGNEVLFEPMYNDGEQNETTVTTKDVAVERWELEQANINWAAECNKNHADRYNDNTDIMAVRDLLAAKTRDGWRFESIFLEIIDYYETLAEQAVAQDNAKAAARGLGPLEKLALPFSGTSCAIPKGLEDEYGVNGIKLRQMLFLLPSGWADDMLLDLLVATVSTWKRVELTAKKSYIVGPTDMKLFTPDELRNTDEVVKALQAACNRADNSTEAENLKYPASRAPPSTQILCFIVNVRGNHWVAVVLRVNNDRTIGTIEIYNSYPGDGQYQDSANRQAPLLAELVSKRPAFGWQNVVWQKPVRIPCILQDNGDDCGFFAFYYATQSALGQSTPPRSTSNLGSAIRFEGLRLLYEMLFRKRLVVPQPRSPIRPPLQGARGPPASTQGAPASTLSNEGAPSDKKKHFRDTSTSWRADVRQIACNVLLGRPDGMTESQLVDAVIARVSELASAHSLDTSTEAEMLTARVNRILETSQPTFVDRDGTYCLTDIPCMRVDSTSQRALFSKPDRPYMVGQAPIRGFTISCVRDSGSVWRKEELTAMVTRARQQMEAYWRIYGHTGVNLELCGTYDELHSAARSEVVPYPRATAKWANYCFRDSSTAALFGRSIGQGGEEGENIRTLLQSLDDAVDMDDCADVTLLWSGVDGGTSSVETYAVLYTGNCWTSFDAGVLARMLCGEEPNPCEHHLRFLIASNLVQYSKLDYSGRRLKETGTSTWHQNALGHRLSSSGRATFVLSAEDEPDLPRLIQYAYTIPIISEWFDDCARPRVLAPCQAWYCPSADCGEVFSTAEGLLEHQANTPGHGDSGEHRCSYGSGESQCGGRFANSAALAQHKTQEGHVHPYICDWKDCGLDYRDTKTLQRHQHTKGHGVGGDGKAKRYPCAFPGCDKHYASPNGLVSHQNNLGHGVGGDGKTKRYPCAFPGCDKHYANRKTLLSHQLSKGHKIDTGLTRPFKCGWPGCGKRYKRRNTKDRHQRDKGHRDDAGGGATLGESCAGPRRLPCRLPGCTKDFGDSFSRQRHEKNMKAHGPSKDMQVVPETGDMVEDIDNDSCSDEERCDSGDEDEDDD